MTTPPLYETETNLGEPLTVGDYRITPVAQVTRWRLPVPGIHAMLIRNRPLAVIVTTPAGAEHTLPVRDETRQARRALLLAGVLGALFIRWALRKRQTASPTRRLTG